MDKGTFSNLVSAALFGVGLVLPGGAFQEVVLSIGMFAFSGGITNALAVKMLFDRIPGLAGSGVIPARFKEIRAKVKNLILEHFFDEAYLRQYFSSREVGIDWKRYVKSSSGSGGPLSCYIEQQWDQMVAPHVVQPIIDRQIEKLMDSSVGGLLMMLGPDAVKPAVNQFVSAFVASLQTRVVEVASRADAKGLEVELDQDRLIADVRANVEILLETKLQELDAMTVKRMMEEVIRHHLGWLVVWGNVFGALLGVIPILLKRYYP